MSLQALVFDVDGTMADTEEAHRTAFNEAFASFYVGWTWQPDTYRRLLGVAGGKERIARFVETLPVSPRERADLLKLVPQIHAEKTRQYNRVVADGGISLRSGIARLLGEATAAGNKLAIASTTTAINVESLLQSALGSRGMDLFDVVACGDVVRAKKPAPDIYHLALRGLGLPPDCAVAFEDSPNGLRAASSAGLITIVTPTYWTEGSDFAAAALCLPELGDPDRPLRGEPGGRLQSAAWLTLDELSRVHARHQVQA